MAAEHLRGYDQAKANAAMAALARTEARWSWRPGGRWRYAHPDGRQHANVTAGTDGFWWEFRAHLHPVIHRDPVTGTGASPDMAVMLRAVTGRAPVPDRRQRVLAAHANGRLVLG